MAALSSAIYSASCNLQPLILRLPQRNRCNLILSLHPGVNSVLELLSLTAEVGDRAIFKPQGYWQIAGESSSFQYYSKDPNDRWQGILIRESVLLEVLEKKARSLGIGIIDISQIDRLIKKAGQIVGLECDGHHQFFAPLTVDASGDRGVLRKKLNLKLLYGSPRLVAQWQESRPYGTREPAFEWKSSGWHWNSGMGTATEIALNLYEKTEYVAASQRCDVTWRYLPECADNGYYVIGDAALRLDPASGTGVLRAIVTGIKAIHMHLTNQNAQCYREFVSYWVRRDADLLAAMYQSQLNDLHWLKRRKWSESPLVY